MRESGSPFVAAVVAAPIRKLCDENDTGLRLQYEASIEMAELSVWRERGDPDDKVNSGESDVVDR